MFGLDDHIAALSSGGSILIVLLVATLLGLRHATDPDHIAAVTTLVATGRERARRRAAALGVWWGLGHALTLVVFGVPILLFEAYLPERRPARRRDRGRGADRLSRRPAARPWHAALRHARTADDEVRTPARRRSASASSTGWAAAPASACCCSRRSPRLPLALASLVVLALFTAVSMTMVTTGFGAALDRAPGCRDGRRARASASRASRSASGTRPPPGASCPTRSRVTVGGVSEPVCVADFEAPRRVHARTRRLRLLRRRRR